MARTAMINPNALNIFPEDVETSVISGFSLIGLTLTAFGSIVTSVPGTVVGFTIVPHEDMARPSQAIPVSHSSSVTTALSPKKS